MKAWFSINNNLLHGVVSEDKQMVYKYDYNDTSYTSNELESIMVGKLAIPITIDPKGGKIVQVKLERMITDIAKINSLIVEVYDWNRKNDIFTSFFSLQIKHKFSAGDQMKEVVLDYLKFEEYLLLQPDSNGNIVQLYPKIDNFNIQDYTIANIKYIDKMDSLVFADTDINISSFIPKTE